jgi:Ca2+/Na+ antiporter
MNSGSELGKLVYCFINLAMVLIGAVIGRRVFAVFGGLGIAGYLGHLSYRVFRDSLVFPFALSALGIGIIFLGVLWQRREAAWSSRLRGLLPAPLRNLIEARASV